MLGVQTKLESFSTFKPQKAPKTKSPVPFRSTKGASKQRRDLINSEIGNMRDLLPFPESTRQRLSQLQIMSLSCVFIRKCNYFSRLFGSQTFSSESNFEFAESLNGFLLTATREGKLLYISENVTHYLGHSMVDMLTQGDSVYDIVDKRDHGVMQGHLHGQLPLSPGAVSDEKAFFCRMNVSRSFRRQAGFGDHKVMHIRGHFVNPMVGDQFGNQPVFMAQCSPLVTPDVKESVTENNTMIFRSVHGLDMKYIEIAKNGEHHLGMSEEEIQGRSWYELIHPEDITEAKNKHMQLIKSSHEMGCMLTVRLMTASCEWIWVNMVLHIRQPFSSDNGDPAIVCTNHVISEHDANGYKLQSQLYSSHIARSPEIFPAPTGGSPHHTISQVSGGEQFQQQQQQQQVDVFGTMSQTQQRTSSVSDSGSESSPQGQKNARTELFNRLKRKMSESSSPPCRPAKMPCQGTEQQGRGGEQGGNGGGLSYTGTIGIAPITNSGSFMESGTFSSSGGTLADPPVYCQLPGQPQININPKDMLYDFQQPSPLTPMSPERSVFLEVNDVAVVPASYLTPDHSPATSPKLQTQSSLLQDLSLLDDISFFAEKISEKPTIKTEVPQVSQVAQVSVLPQLDVPSIEEYLATTEPVLPTPDEMMQIMEQSIKKEEVDEDLVSMCESLLESAAASSYDLLSVGSAEEEEEPASANHEQLLEELSQLSSVSSSPSYGDDLESVFFHNSAL